MFKFQSGHMLSLKIITCFLLLSNVVISQINEGIVTYKKSFEKSFAELNQDLKDKDRESFEKYNEFMKRAEEVVNLLDFKLVYNNTESLFSVDDFIDSEADQRFLGLAVGPLGARIYYYNGMKNNYLVETDAFGDLFVVEMLKHEWVLVNQQKVINGYPCYKANTLVKIQGRNGELKKEAEAWYCNDLPQSYGPLGFNGLPGLIIQLTYNNEVYTVSQIDASPKRPVKIVPPSKGKKVTKEEFEEIGNKAMSNFNSGMK